MTVIQFIEKHKFGILGTIALHMIIFIWLNVNIIEYGSYQPKEKVIAILDFENQEEENPEEDQAETLDENGNPTDPLTNVAANADQEQTSYTNQSNYSFNKNQADQDVWNELKALEANEYNAINANKQNNNSDKSNDAEKNENIPDINPNLIKEDAEKNEKASYSAKINATAKYYLKDRSFLRKKVPAYMCITEGVVRVNIKVNQKGDVVSTEIDESHTNTQDDCLRSQAVSYAKKWHFTQNFNDEIRKDGWIEFSYEAQ